MLAFLSDLTYWHWFGMGVLLLIVELLIVNSGFLLWVAMAAISLGLIVVLFPVTWPYQLILFVSGILLYAMLGRRYLQRHPIDSDKPHLNKRCEQYLGQIFVLQTAIENGRGSIYVNDTIWRVSGPDLPVGTRVKVTGADGVVLQVSAAD